MRQSSEVTRPSADCQTTFFDVSGRRAEFWKKSLNGHRQLSEAMRPSADSSNNLISTFHQKWHNFKKKSLNGHATVVGGHATAFGGHAAVGWLSNNLYFDVSSQNGKLLKKSPNGHATVRDIMVIKMMNCPVFDCLKASGSIKPPER